METKKLGLQNYLEYSFNSILMISFRSGDRALDPKFGQNRIHDAASDTVNWFTVEEKKKST